MENVCGMSDGGGLFNLLVENLVRNINIETEGKHRKRVFCGKFSDNFDGGSGVGGVVVVVSVVAVMVVMEVVAAEEGSRCWAGKR